MVVLLAVLDAEVEVVLEPDRVGDVQAPRSVDSYVQNPALTSCAELPWNGVE
jgi:hypothetical protein